MSKNYDSKVNEIMKKIDEGRLQNLRRQLREQGEAGDDRFDANSVYNMSPEALRAAANEVIDKEAVIDNLNIVVGVNMDTVREDTADMSPVETWEYASDTVLKATIVGLRPSDDVPNEVPPVKLDHLIRWREAEGKAMWREILEENYPDTDFSSMHEREVNEFLADEAIKQELDKTGVDLDSDTLIMHKRADLIGDLTTNYGYDREALEKLNLGQLVEEHALAASGTEQGNNMMPGDVGEAPPTKTPGQYQDERLQDKLENNHRTAAESGNTGNASSVQGNDPTQGSSASGQSDPASGLGGSNADTHDLFPSTGAAVGATTGATTGSATAGAGANAPGQTGDVPTGQSPPSVDGADKASVTSGDVFTVKDGDGKYSVVFTDLDEIDDAGASDADADASSGDDGEGSESGDDTGADAEPPPDTDDGKDLEYTPSGEGGTMPGTRGHDRYEELTGDYVAIKDAVRGSSTINPEREGSDDAVGDSSSGKSLTGSDGDSRYDSVASESAGGSQAGQGFGNSQGAGAITYGPDSDVDFGVGLEDDVPMSVGPQEDLSHLAETTFGSSESESTNSSSLPDGVSPADLKVSDGTPSAVADAMPVGRAQPVEQVTYWAVPEQQQTTSNGDSSQSLDVFETKDTSNSGDSGDRSVAAEKSGLRQEVQVEVEPERSDAKASLKDNAVTEDVSTATTQKSIDFAGKETQATDNSVPAPEKTELVFDSRVDTEVVSHVPVNKLQQEPSGNLEPEPAEVVLPSAEQVEPVNVPSIEISHADPIGVDLTNVQEAEWDESGSDDGDDGL